MYAPSFRRGLCIVESLQLVMMLIQQMTGINVFIYFPSKLLTYMKMSESLNVYSLCSNLFTTIIVIIIIDRMFYNNDRCWS